MFEPPFNIFFPCLIFLILFKDNFTKQLQQMGHFEKKNNKKKS